MLVTLISDAVPYNCVCFSVILKTLKIYNVRENLHLRRAEDVEEFEEMMDPQLVRQSEVYDWRSDHICVLNQILTFRFSEDGVYALGGHASQSAAHIY